MLRAAIRIARSLLPAAVLLGAPARATAQVFQYDERDAGFLGSLGFAVAQLGDYDGDGHEDFIVGEPDAYSSSGVVWVFSGSDGSVLLVEGAGHQEEMGHSVDGNIDFDHDGYVDMLVGMPGAGWVDVQSIHDPSHSFIVGPGVAGDRFGAAVRTLSADIDGDGYEDFVVGAPGDDKAYVFSSKSGAQLFQVSGQSGARFGFSVSRGGNLDGDGIDDFLVGSPDFVDSNGKKTGRVTAFSGKDGSRIWSVDGVADSLFGYALAAPEDFDGDTYTDVVVGAPHHLDSNGVQTGCVTVLSGKGPSVLYKVFGDGDGDGFGHSVRTVSGDIDNDGIKDFIAGAPQFSASDVGYARTISGATGSVLFTYLPHNGTKCNFGCAVAGGNFCGGKRRDVVIGGSSFNGGDGIVELWRTVAASAAHYGTGWAGTFGIPTLHARTDPVIGQSLDLFLDNSLGAKTSGLFLLGLSQTSLKTGKGGILLVDPLLWLPLAIPAGGLTISGMVPDDPALYGVDLDLQALEFDAGASNGISFTDGLDLTLGGP
jgi:hypothetical protein